MSMLTLNQHGFVLAFDISEFLRVWFLLFATVTTNSLWLKLHKSFLFETTLSKLWVKFINIFDPV